MPITQHKTPETASPRPHANMPLSELVDQIGFAYNDDVMPEFELLSELVHRAEAAETAR